MDDKTIAEIRALLVDLRERIEAVEEGAGEMDEPLFSPSLTDRLRHAIESLRAETTSERMNRLVAEREHMGR